jgi:hypothetical protein
MMRPPIGLPLSMPRGGPMDGSYRFSPQGPVIMSGGPPGMNRPQMQISMGPRGPMPGGPMVLSRMPGPPPPGVHSQQSVLVMQQPQRSGVPQGVNGPPLLRQPIRPGTPGGPVPSNSMTGMPGQHPPGYYPGQPGQGVFVIFLFNDFFKSIILNFSHLLMVILFLVNHILIHIIAVLILVMIHQI